MTAEELVALVQSERLIEVAEAAAFPALQPLRGWDLAGWHIMGRDGVVLFVHKDGTNTIREAVLCVYADEERRGDFAVVGRSGYPVTVLMRGQFKE